MNRHIHTSVDTHSPAHNTAGNTEYLETKMHRPAPYRDMAAENSSEFSALFSKALPSGLKPDTSFRVHWLVFRMKLQSWGTSSSTYTTEEWSIKSLHQECEIPTPSPAAQGLLPNQGTKGNAAGEQDTCPPTPRVSSTGLKGSL